MSENICKMESHILTTAHLFGMEAKGLKMNTHKLKVTLTAVDCSCAVIMGQDDLYYKGYSSLCVFIMTS